MVYITRSNFFTGAVDQIGPFSWVQLTYNEVRISNKELNEKFRNSMKDGWDFISDTIAIYIHDSFNHVWKFVDGTEWTDLIITDSYEVGQS